MKVPCTSNDREMILYVMQRELGEAAVYTPAPVFAYTVGGCALLREGCIVTDREEVLLTLASLGLCDYPYRLALADAPGGAAHEFDAVKAAEIRQQYKHPLWETWGEFAAGVGGHGGMDFIMDLRLSFCLQNGLPLDMDVYDLATSCCLQELSERSVKNRSASMDIPDFTRGGWKTAQPLGIVNVDPEIIGLDPKGPAKKSSAALNV